MSDEPKDHRCIRIQEVEYIETNRPILKKQSGVPPYWQILLCPAVWTVMACDFANGWGLFVLLNDGPTFVDKVLNQDITTVKLILSRLRSSHSICIIIAFSRMHFRNLRGSSVILAFNDICHLANFSQSL